MAHFCSIIFPHKKNGIPVETIEDGKGKWIESKKVIELYSDIGSDIKGNYTLNFFNSKVKFITKSSRDQSDKIVITRLQFLQSDITWMARIELF